MRVVRNASRILIASAVLAGVLVGAVACQRSEVGKDTVPVETATEPLKVNVEQVEDWMNQGVEFVMLDSRGEGGWSVAVDKAKGAIRVPPHDVEAHLESIPGESRLIVYCT